MSTITSRSHVGPWEPSDFAWAVPTIVLLLLLIGTVGVISGFPAPNAIGPDSLFLGVP
jgi:hypothetical protein